MATLTGDVIVERLNESGFKVVELDEGYQYEARFWVDDAEVTVFETLQDMWEFLACRYPNLQEEWTDA